eukprot:509106-Pelagomonas_calceolata.AAC.4
MFREQYGDDKYGRRLKRRYKDRYREDFIGQAACDRVLGTGNLACKEKEEGEQLHLPTQAAQLLVFCAALWLTCFSSTGAEQGGGGIVLGTQQWRFGAWLPGAWLSTLQAPTSSIPGFLLG